MRPYGQRMETAGRGAGEGGPLSRRERIAKGVGTLTYADHERLISRLFIHEKKGSAGYRPRVVSADIC